MMKWVVLLMVFALSIADVTFARQGKIQITTVVSQPSATASTDYVTGAARTEEPARVGGAYVTFNREHEPTGTPMLLDKR